MGDLLAVPLVDCWDNGMVDPLVAMMELKLEKGRVDDWDWWLALMKDDGRAAVKAD